MDNNKTTITKTYKRIEVVHIFIDIVAFTYKRSNETQFEIIQELDKIVKSTIKDNKIDVDNITFIPTGDGMCISIKKACDEKYFDFPIKIALTIMKKIYDYNLRIKNDDSVFEDKKRFDIRIGINENIDNFFKDINNNDNYAGKGINEASRLESAADCKQIIIGRSIYDKVSSSREYIGKFRHFKKKIKHNLFLDIYQYTDSNLNYINSNSPETISKEEKSIAEVKKEYNINKEKNIIKENGDSNNFIVLESTTSSTLLKNKIEITTKKYIFEILEDGEFIFSYDFDTPSDNDKLSADTYKNTENEDRFNKTSYNFLATSSLGNQGYEIINELTNLIDPKDEPEKYPKPQNWIHNKFYKASVKEKEIITIEVSTSHKFELTKCNEINDYFKSYFVSAHAVRYFIFQIEKYSGVDNFFKRFMPILKNNNKKKLQHIYNESIYYNTYKWKVYYDEDNTKELEINMNIRDI